MTNMYEGAKTWNCFVGCAFDCVYCVPTFQAQAKRQLHNCRKCYDYTPHEHPERLAKIPGGSRIVFVCGSGDIALASHDYISQIIEAIKKRNAKFPKRTYYLQSKWPAMLGTHIDEMPDNVILVTTLETNRDEGYAEISSAPPPTDRYRQFLALDWPHKVITIEPVMDFDLDTFAAMIVSVRPECVWLGYNTRPKQVTLPEPHPLKLRDLVQELTLAGIPIRGKELRGQFVIQGELR